MTSKSLPIIRGGGNTPPALSGFPLLTVGYGNPKTAKGEKRGYRTAVLHLAPHTLSGYNVCPMATAGCAAACLNTAGRGGMSTKGVRIADIGDRNVIQRARVRRTREYFENRPAFVDKLVREISAFVRHADRAGLVPVVRLNGTSDIRWESVPVGDSPNVFALFPDLQFYDYTKLPNRKGVPRNCHLTYSLAESDRNRKGHLVAMSAGVNVAVVLRGFGDSAHPQPFPARLWGRPLIDGDESDLRFLDGRTRGGSYVGLRAKGRARTDSSGFVYSADDPRPGVTL